jgi:hypothetical protein
MKVKNLLKTSVSAAFLVSALNSVAVLADTSMWKVSKGNDYVYIGGTVHMLPESAFPLPAEFAAAYNATDTLVLEANLPEPTDTEAQTLLLREMAYSDGRSLAKVLSPEVYERVGEYFSTYGIQLQQLDGYKPGFIVVQMMALEMMKAKMDGEGVDSYFDKQAKADGRKLMYLETVESQINLLANMGNGYEDAFIKMNMDLFGDYEQYYTDMISAWRTGNTDQLNKLVLEPARTLDPLIYQDIFVKRNTAWLPLIKQMFDNGSKELVLVGGGHLAGEHSVLVLLEREGYAVEQVTLSN